MQANFFSFRTWRQTKIDVFGSVIASTLVVAVCWRLYAALGSPLVLASLFLPLVIYSSRGVAPSLTGLAVSCAGAIYILKDSPTFQQDIIAFLFSGSFLMSGAFIASASIHRKTHEVRHAALASHKQSRAMVDEMGAAGTCIMMMDHQMVWSGINRAAWHALGCPAELYQESMKVKDYRLDNVALTSLMHSGSRESWGHLMNTIKTESLATESEYHPSRHSLHELRLYTASGVLCVHMFVAIRTRDGGFVLCGFPLPERQ